MSVKTLILAVVIFGGGYITGKNLEGDRLRDLYSTKCADVITRLQSEEEFCPAQDPEYVYLQAPAAECEESTYYLYNPADVSQRHIRYLDELPPYYLDLE